ncbi:MAG: hypothetical protein OES13_00270 [Acidimicrobiia bacterium]|nr:hypothetical protein [Acidimicrobiia bacterium]
MITNKMVRYEAPEGGTGWFDITEVLSVAPWKGLKDEAKEQYLITFRGHEEGFGMTARPHAVRAKRTEALEAIFAQHFNA